VTKEAVFVPLKAILRSGRGLLEKIEKVEVTFDVLLWDGRVH
jgi:hypothetical protein